MIEDLQNSKTFVTTLVYGLHTASDRRPLWDSIISIANGCNSPWIVLGDFNEVMDTHEISGDNHCRLTGMDDLTECFNKACLDDLRFTGILFTWSNRRIGRQDFTERKLDRALINSDWLDSYPNSNAFFKAPGISDHSPIIVDMGGLNRKKGVPFKFYNHWVSMDNFDNVVNNSWTDDINGTYQFQLFQNLKRLKANLKTWAKNHFGKEKQIVTNARAALLECQTKIALYPNDMTYRALEKDLLSQFLDATHREEEVAKQKAKIHWLDVGDRNTKYFYNAIKGRRNRNRIVKLKKRDGTITSNNDETKEETIRYFESMLGSSPPSTYSGLASIASIVKKRISQDQFDILSSIPTDDEIKATLFSIHSNKAPGPDGFNAFFFKHCWNTVGPLVLKAIKEFFNTGEILKESNSTIITLIPKVPNPSAMTEFRPISCCNTIYKCISKLIANRLQTVLPLLIGESQSAFIKGRNISDNVLLAQDLLRDYHKRSGKPRMAAKVDLMKAYDTVNWGFLFDLLQVLHFPLL